MDFLPKIEQDQIVNISNEGINYILNNIDPKCP